MAETDPFAALHAQQSVAVPAEKPKKTRKPRVAKSNGGDASAAPNAFLFFSHLLEQLSAMPGDTRKEVVAALVKLCK